MASNFSKIQDKVAKLYRKKWMSPAKAKEAGGWVAYEIGVKKYGKAGMSAKAVAGRRK